MTFDGKSVKRNNNEYLAIENSKLSFKVNRWVIVPGINFGKNSLFSQKRSFYFGDEFINWLIVLVAAVIIQIAYNEESSRVIATSMNWRTIFHHFCEQKKMICSCCVIYRLIFDFQNLYNGDKLLGDSTNRFLNENWNDIFKEIRANIFDAFTLIIENTLRNVFNKAPYNDIFAN